MESYNITIGEGIDSIKFGITREELNSKLGDPSEVEQFCIEEDENEYYTEAWHYDDHNVSFTFDEEDNWRLTTIASNDDSLTLSDNKIADVSSEKIIALINDLNLGEYEIEELEEDQKVITVLASSINFWFENDELSEVQWGVLWENEDTPKWP